MQSQGTNLDWEETQRGGKTVTTSQIRRAGTEGLEVCTAVWFFGGVFFLVAGHGGRPL